MAIGIIVGIIIVALLIGAGVVCFNAMEDENTTLGLISGIAALVLALAFIVVPFSFHTVQTGQVAVVKHLGKATHVKICGYIF